MEKKLLGNAVVVQKKKRNINKSLFVRDPQARKERSLSIHMERVRDQMRRIGRWGS